MTKTWALRTSAVLFWNWFEQMFAKLSNPNCWSHPLRSTPVDKLRNWLLTANTLEIPLHSLNLRLSELLLFWNHVEAHIFAVNNPKNWLLLISTQSWPLLNIWKFAEHCVSWSNCYQQTLNTIFCWTLRLWDWVTFLDWSWKATNYD